jgi:tetratricopeptide (TPR) repeat protein
MSGYTRQEVARMLGLTPGRLRAYLRSGVLSPDRGERGELRFSFQDLILLRTAEGLVRDRIAPHRVARALRKLRERLPETRPLTGLQLAADGASVVVRDGDARWHAESGQVLLDFDRGAAPPPAEAPPTPLPTRPAATATPEPAAAAAAGADARTANLVGLTVDELYEIGCDIEETDPLHAEASYRQVLSRAPSHADAHVNLGRLLHERGDLPGAEKHYREALAARPNDPTATFNLGVAMEDLGQLEEALRAYERAIVLNAENADAHYNAARLYEKTGDYGAALRHLRVYRDLTRKSR